MSSTVLILNGPNLNLLGMRETEIYGLQSLDDIRRMCDECAASLSFKTDFKQSNHEGELIGWIHSAQSSGAKGLIINPAGLGHSSIALMDAILSVRIPSIEVHLSNIFKREEFRHHTYTSHAVNGVISGFGAHSYVLALHALGDLLKKHA